LIADADGVFIGDAQIAAEAEGEVVEGEASSAEADKA